MDYRRPQQRPRGAHVAKGKQMSDLFAIGDDDRATAPVALHGEA
jgi:hypothetical protein